MSVLHACVIPLFCLHSIRPTDATDTPAAATEADTEMETETDPMAYESLQRASAQKALYHARQISHIISKSALNGVQLLSSGFTGYAAYSSCAIQLPFLWCRSTNVREMARRNIQVNIAIMDYIQSQWKVVAALRGYIPLLYKHHENMSYSLADEPVNLQLADLNLHCKADSNRATMSILHNNAITWDKGELLNHNNLPDIGLATRRRPQQQQQLDKGETLREQKLRFRPDWENVITPVVEYALSQEYVDEKKLVIMGISMGGFLVARAAAFEHRAAAIVVNDGIFDFGDSFRRSTPAIIKYLLKYGWYGTVNRLLGFVMPMDTGLSWALRNGQWVFGVTSGVEVLEG
ncbi:hypothetical protein ACSS6W_005991 [Trichoderma asperelloides]